MPRKPMNGVRLHVIVTKPQDRELDKLVKKTGIPKSEVLRRAIDFYIGNQK